MSLKLNTNLRKILEGMPVLVTGAHGMLATDLISLGNELGLKMILSDRETRQRNGRTFTPLDVTNPQDVNRVVALSKPKWIINCAAYTAVDAAEGEPARAYAVNSTGPRNLALAAQDFGANLLHLSTDYVFGGAGNKRATPYLETDLPSPCGVYGKSKLEGEQWVNNLTHGKALIIRTSWLHGKHGRNFVDTMLALGRQQKVVSVVNDQIGSPTWTGWLAEIMLELVARDVRGIVHCSSRGDISWFDVAKEIFLQAGLPVEVQPQSTAELNRAAPRPAFSTLSVAKLEKLIERPCISWQENISLHLDSLKSA